MFIEKRVIEKLLLGGKGVLISRVKITCSHKQCSIPFEARDIPELIGEAKHFDYE